MEEYMKDNMKMIKNMVLEYLLDKITDMKEIGKKERWKVKELLQKMGK
jgi:hypothetical protein